MNDSRTMLPSVASDVTTAAKKPYAKPRLIPYGDLRTLTLGPSPGIGESGNPAVFRAR